jgi:hypothetical protein
MKKNLIVLVTFFIGIVNINCAQANEEVMCATGGANFARCAADWETSFQNGNKMEDTATAWNIANFQGFIDGIVSIANGNIWCPKTMIPLDQIYAMTAKYVRENPDKWNAQPSLLVIKPLSKAFPCINNHKKKYTKPDVAG